MNLRITSTRIVHARSMSERVVSAHIMSARIFGRLASLAAGLQAAFQRSRLRLCRRVGRHGLAAID